MPFIRNAWYAAAMSDEVDRTFIHRLLLGRDVVLFRKEQGAPVALENMCPHRFAPLDRGRLIGDEVECGYHGLVFDCEGTCVRNPHGQISASARVRSYPVVERHRFVWIWMGERNADPDLVPDCGFVDMTEQSVSSQGYMYVLANYQLIIDNNLDLSHTDYLHRGSFGGNAGNTPQLEVMASGKGIQVTRRFPNGKPSAANIAATDYRGPVDRWQEARWDPPGILYLNTGSTPTGRPRSEGVSQEPWLILTPETETTTHCFYGKARRFKLEDRELDKALHEQMRIVVENEDNSMIEAQQRYIAERDLMALSPILLSCDNAAVRARREIQRLLAGEQQAPTVTE
jgi:vanillate O-demethylase monooxygenase subunit